MDIFTKFRRSIYYWLVSVVPSSVTVVDEFPDNSIELPGVSITNLEISGKPFELGGAEQNDLMWRIDVFADKKTTRDELAYLIYNELENYVSVYDYDEGFPPSASPSKIGRLVIAKRVLKPIRVFEDLVEKLYWRTAITFYSKYEAE